MKEKILKEIRKKQYNSNKEIVIELITLAPKGVFFDPLDCILLDEYEDCCLASAYYKLLNKLYGQNTIVNNYLNENWNLDNNFWHE